MKSLKKMEHYRPSRGREGEVRVITEEEAEDYMKSDSSCQTFIYDMETVFHGEAEQQFDNVIHQAAAKEQNSQRAVNHQA